MTPVEGSGIFTKFVEAVKDLPAWLFSAFAVASAVLLFVPAASSELPKEYRPWMVIGFVVFGVLTVFKWTSVGVAAFRAHRLTIKRRKTYHLTFQRAMWSVSKQADDSLVTQLMVDFIVKNISTTSVGLMRARIIKPKIRGDVLHDLITVRHQRSEFHGTPKGSDYRCEPGILTPARVSVLVRGKPRCREDADLKVLLGIIDDEGNEQRITVVCNGQPKVPSLESVVKMEAVHKIANPIEKEVAAVLQSELSRYDKNGRSSGGLGSLHLIYRGTAMPSFGGDSWTPNSSANQEIAADPEKATLHSDSLQALLALHERLTSDDARERFANALLERLQEDKGYARVAYLIVGALWKIGRLEAALDAVKFGLQENDMKTFGVSNVLMLFNGLLRYRHPDFNTDMLDALENFLQDSEEHAFHIPQKMAAIRASRLLSGTQF